MTVDEGTVDLELDRPHSARMYDYYLGGTTNFPADREAVGQVMSIFPSVLVTARVNRAFVRRSTRFLAEQGMRQFLDIGTGIPTSPNLHEVAQSVAPGARIVYTDNDPIVLAHAQALLHSHEAGRTAYVAGDVTDPDSILNAPGLHETLDLDRPVALSLNALLHFVPDDLGAYEIVEKLKAALPPGSTLTITHATADFDPEGVARLAEIYQAAGTAGQARSRAEFSHFFDGWDLVDPGITPSHLWRPDDAQATANITDAEASCYAAVARKP